MCEGGVMIMGGKMRMDQSSKCQVVLFNGSECKGYCDNIGDGKAD